MTFRGPADSVVMRVSCSGGTPVAHLYEELSDYGDDEYSAGPSGSPSAGPGE